MPQVKTQKLPKIPTLLDRKIYKTGQTRGADDDVLFQNRVGRNSTVLIPSNLWDKCRQPPENSYENDFIVLISPTDYFKEKDIDKFLEKQGLFLGQNLIVFYETREEWNTYNPTAQNWSAATKRKNPLGGQYAARVPATTAIEQGKKISHGFNLTTLKGAGIRVYEYANSATITDCRLQLEALFWHCYDAEAIALEHGMSLKDSTLRKYENLKNCEEKGLLDLERFKKSRMIDSDHHTVCPLCLDKLTGAGFFNKVSQAEGREVHDLTVTQINLFHIEELRYGALNHKTYNLGWGHHHCNVVVKDSGIKESLAWMQSVLSRNISLGFSVNKAEAD